MDTTLLDDMKRCTFGGHPPPKWSDLSTDNLDFTYEALIDVPSETEARESFEAVAVRPDSQAFWASAHNGNREVVVLNETAYTVTQRESTVSMHVLPA